MCDGKKKYKVKLDPKFIHELAVLETIYDR